MILKYTIPQRVKELISLSGDERIYYAVPFDIGKDALFSDDSYLVVTTKRCLSLNRVNRAYLMILKI